MIAAAHVAAGAVAGLLAARVTRRASVALVLSFAVGVASHVAMDAIPHSDYGSLSRGAALGVALGEVVVMVFVISSMMRGRVTPPDASCMTAGAVGAMLPDVKSAAMLFPGQLGAPIVEFWERFHALHAAPHDAETLGLVLEVTVTVLLLFWLARLRPRASRVEASSVRRTG